MSNIYIILSVAPFCSNVLLLLHYLVCSIQRTLNVSAFPLFMTYLVLFVGTEEAGVVSFLHHDKGDAGLVAELQLDACLTHRSQFMMQHLQGEEAR